MGDIRYCTRCRGILPEGSESPYCENCVKEMQPKPEFQDVIGYLNPEIWVFRREYNSLLSDYNDNYKKAMSAHGDYNHQYHEYTRLLNALERFEDHYAVRAVIGARIRKIEIELKRLKQEYTSQFQKASSKLPRLQQLEREIAQVEKVVSILEGADTA